MHESEDRLVQEAVKRNRAAFAILYDRCVDRVYRHVHYRVSNHADAEDITQETFLRAWQSIDRFKNTGAPFIAWLITIANNLANSHYRTRAKTIITDSKFEDKSDNHVSDPAGLAETNFDDTLVKDAVLKLKGDKQKVILMHFIDGFDYSEIARILNKSEGAVRVIQFRALDELRHLLKQD
jgi:RNA polymerase sigma-70 factor, ECF subfamily